MKRGFCILIAWLAGLLSVLAQNRALHLDGRGAHIELPAQAFINLTQATVEAWVKFEDFSLSSRVFDFGGRSHEMYLGCVGTQPDLKFLIADPDANRHRIEVAGAWTPGRWCHVAISTGS